MIIIKPTIEIIDMADYQDILKRLRELAESATRVRTKSVRILRSVLLRVL